MIAIGSDHGGYNLKEYIKAQLTKRGISVEDIGTYTTESCDYPLIASKVAKKILSKECELGILCCGTGIGMSMAANKIKGIRAAALSDVFSAKYTRLHNDANILCLGERVLGMGLAMELVDIFLSTGFEGGRHQRRVDLITDLEG